MPVGRLTASQPKLSGSPAVQRPQPAAGGRLAQAANSRCSGANFHAHLAILGCSKFDPETKRIMGLAFEMIRLALGLADRGDIANELIAKRIIELAQAGELNPDVLCEAVVKELRVQRL
jgi:hypothetical protein